MPLNDKIATSMLFEEGSACHRQHNGRKQFTPRRVFQLLWLSLSERAECGNWTQVQREPWGGLGMISGGQGWLAEAQRHAASPALSFRDTQNRQKSLCLIGARQGCTRNQGPGSGMMIPKCDLWWLAHIHLCSLKAPLQVSSTASRYLTCHTH